MRDNILGILLLAVVFALSIFVRQSQLSRPLTGADDIHAIQTMIPMQVWAESAENATKIKYNPILTFPNRGDSFIQDLGNVQDKKGNNYWVKYPQLGFMLPHFILQNLHLPSKHYGFYLMQINIGLHFLCSLFVFLAILSILAAVYPHTKYASATAFLGAAIYCFLPQSLYYQSIGYFPEMLSQLWLIMSFWVIAKMILREKGNALNITLLAIFVFGYVYTDWFALFSVLGICIYCVTHLSQSPSGRVWYITMFVTLAGLMLSFWQYSSVLTSHKLMDTLGNVFQEESGWKAHSFAELWGNGENWQQLLGFYGYGFALLLGVLVIALLLLLINGKLKETFNNYGKTISLLFWVLCFPSFLYQLIFFQSAHIHSFLVLKMSYFFVISTAIFCHPLISNQEGKTVGKWLNPILLTACLVVCVSFSLFAYQKATENINPDPYWNLGIAIKQKAKPEESLLIKASHWEKVPPVLIHYAGRNIQLYKDSTDVNKLLNNNNADRAVIFVLDSMQNYTLPARYIYKKN